MTMDASHLDDDAISASLDGALPDAAGQSHLAGCAVCTARRDELGAARSALAGAPVEPVDDLTRRRMVATALEAFGPVVRARPWYQRPALAGGVAAVLLALFAAVPFVTGDDSTDGGEQATAALEAAGGEFLGDLGDLSDPAVLRGRFATRRTTTLSEESAERSDDTGAGAATGSVEAGKSPGAPAPPQSPASAEPFATASPMAADSAAQNQGGSGPAARDGRAGGLDRTVADACARTLAEGPAWGSTLVAVGTGTFEGDPAVVAVFEGAGGTTAFVASRDGCRVLSRFTL
jgi:hypothetical protein